MKIEGSTVTLSSGRTFYANGGRLSLNRHGDICEGYDGEITFLSDDVRDDDDPQPWTAAEREEIGTFMIRRWADWMGALSVRIVAPGKLERVEMTVGVAGATDAARKAGT